MCVLFLCTTLPATLQITARNQRHVVINTQTASSKFRLLCGVLLEREFYSQILQKIADTKINENPYSCSRFVPWGQTDGQTDMPKLICLLQLCERTSSHVHNPRYTISIQKMAPDRMCSWAAMRNKLCYLVKWRWLDGSGQIEGSDIWQIWCVQKQTDWTECHTSTVPQKHWSFEMPLTAPVKGNNSQAWLTPKLNADKLKYWHCTGGYKDHSLIPQSLETKASPNFERTSDSSTYLHNSIHHTTLDVPTHTDTSDWYLCVKHVEKYTEPYTTYPNATFVKGLKEPYIAALCAKDTQNYPQPYNSYLTVRKKTCLQIVALAILMLNTFTNSQRLTFDFLFVPINTERALYSLS
jgi:hypothetical protein